MLSFSLVGSMTADTPSCSWATATPGSEVHSCHIIRASTGNGNPIPAPDQPSECAGRTHATDMPSTAQKAPVAPSTRSRSGGNNGVEARWLTHKQAVVPTDHCLQDETVHHTRGRRKRLARRCTRVAATWLMPPDSVRSQRAQDQKLQDDPPLVLWTGS